MVGAPQRLHFKQLFKILELMGFPWAKNCVHVDFGHIQGMKTRDGTIIFLEEVLERAFTLARDIIRAKNPDLKDPEGTARAVALGAVIFNDLKNKRIKDITFDWDRMLSFDGDTGPYLQYAHVRLCGILEKFGNEVRGDVDFSLLCESETLALLRLLEAYPQKVKLAARQYEPSVISGYMLEIASALNTFYHAHRVVGSDPERTRARILRVWAIRRVLSHGLSLLGIRALEKR